jgi:hypothetical protein
MQIGFFDGDLETYQARGFHDAAVGAGFATGGLIM